MPPPEDFGAVNHNPRQTPHPQTTTQAQPQRYVNYPNLYQTGIKPYRFVTQLNHRTPSQTMNNTNSNSHHSSNHGHRPTASGNGTEQRQQSEQKQSIDLADRLFGRSKRAHQRANLRKELIAAAAHDMSFVPNVMNGFTGSPLSHNAGFGGVRPESPALPYNVLHPTGHSSNQFPAGSRSRPISGQQDNHFSHFEQNGFAGAFSFVPSTPSKHSRLDQDDLHEPDILPLVHIKNPDLIQEHASHSNNIDVKIVGQLVIENNNTDSTGTFSPSNIFPPQRTHRSQSQSGQLPPHSAQFQLQIQPQTSHNNPHNDNNTRHSPSIYEFRPLHREQSYDSNGDLRVKTQGDSGTFGGNVANLNNMLPHQHSPQNSSHRSKPTIHHFQSQYSQSPRSSQNSHLGSNHPHNVHPHHPHHHIPQSPALKPKNREMISQNPQFSAIRSPFRPTGQHNNNKHQNTHYRHIEGGDENSPNNHHHYLIGSQESLFGQSPFKRFSPKNTPTQNRKKHYNNRGSHHPTHLPQRSSRYDPTLAFSPIGNKPVGMSPEQLDECSNPQQQQHVDETGPDSGLNTVSNFNSILATHKKSSFEVSPVGSVATKLTKPMPNTTSPVNLNLLYLGKSTRTPEQTQGDGPAPSPQITPPHRQQLRQNISTTPQSLVFNLSDAGIDEQSQRDSGPIFDLDQETIGQFTGGSPTTQTEGNNRPNTTKSSQRGYPSPLVMDCEPLQLVPLPGSSSQQVIGFKNDCRYCDFESDPVQCPHKVTTGTEHGSTIVSGGLNQLFAKFNKKSELKQETAQKKKEHQTPQNFQTLGNIPNYKLSPYSLEIFFTLLFELDLKRSLDSLNQDNYTVLIPITCWIGPDDRQHQLKHIPKPVQVPETPTRHVSKNPSPHQSPPLTPSNNYPNFNVVTNDTSSPFPSHRALTPRQNTLGTPTISQTLTWSHVPTIGTQVSVSSDTGSVGVKLCDCFVVLDSTIRAMKQAYSQGALEDYILSLPEQGNCSSSDVLKDLLGDEIDLDISAIDDHSQRNETAPVHKTTIFTQLMARAVEPFMTAPLAFLPTIGVVHVHPTPFGGLNKDTVDSEEYYYEDNGRESQSSLIPNHSSNPPETPFKPASVPRNFSGGNILPDFGTPIAPRSTTLVNVLDFGSPIGKGLDFGSPIGKTFPQNNALDFSSPIGKPQLHPDDFGSPLGGNPVFKSHWDTQDPEPESELKRKQLQTNDNTLSFHYSGQNGTNPIVSTMDNTGSDDVYDLDIPNLTENSCKYLDNTDENRGDIQTNANHASLDGYSAVGSHKSIRDRAVRQNGQIFPTLTLDDEGNGRGENTQSQSALSVASISRIKIPTAHHVSDSPIPIGISPRPVTNVSEPVTPPTRQHSQANTHLLRSTSAVNPSQYILPSSNNTQSLNSFSVQLNNSVNNTNLTSPSQILIPTTTITARMTDPLNTASALDGLGLTKHSSDGRIVMPNNGGVLTIQSSANATSASPSNIHPPVITTDRSTTDNQDSTTKAVAAVSTLSNKSQQQPHRPPAQLHQQSGHTYKQSPYQTTMPNSTPQNNRTLTQLTRLGSNHGQSQYDILSEMNDTVLSLAGDNQKPIHGDEKSEKPTLVYLGKNGSTPTHGSGDGGNSGISTKGQRPMTSVPPTPVANPSTVSRFDPTFHNAIHPKDSMSCQFRQTDQTQSSDQFSQHESFRDSMSELNDSMRISGAIDDVTTPRASSQYNRSISQKPFLLPQPPTSIQLTQSQRSSPKQQHPQQINNTATSINSQVARTNSASPVTASAIPQINPIPQTNVGINGPQRLTIPLSSQPNPQLQVPREFNDSSSAITAALSPRGGAPQRAAHFQTSESYPQVSAPASTVDANNIHGSATPLTATVNLFEANQSRSAQSMHATTVGASSSLNTTNLSRLPATNPSTPLSAPPPSISFVGFGGSFPPFTSPTHSRAGAGGAAPFQNNISQSKLSGKHESFNVTQTPTQIKVTAKHDPFDNTNVQTGIILNSTTTRLSGKYDPLNSSSSSSSTLPQQQQAQLSGRHDVYVAPSLNGSISSFTRPNHRSGRYSSILGIERGKIDTLEGGTDHPHQDKNRNLNTSSSSISSIQNLNNSSTTIGSVAFSGINIPPSPIISTTNKKINIPLPSIAIPTSPHLGIAGTMRHHSTAQSSNTGENTLPTPGNNIAEPSAARSSSLLRTGSTISHHSNQTSQNQDHQNEPTHLQPSEANSPNTLNQSQIQYQNTILSRTASNLSNHVPSRLSSLSTRRFSSNTLTTTTSSSSDANSSGAATTTTQTTANAPINLQHRQVTPKSQTPAATRDNLGNNDQSSRTDHSQDFQRGSILSSPPTPDYPHQNQNQRGSILAPSAATTGNADNNDNKNSQSQSHRGSSMYSHHGGLSPSYSHRDSLAQTMVTNPIQQQQMSNYPTPQQSTRSQLPTFTVPNEQVHQHRASMITPTITTSPSLRSPVTNETGIRTENNNFGQHSSSSAFGSTSPNDSHLPVNPSPKTMYQVNPNNFNTQPLKRATVGPSQTRSTGVSPYQTPKMNPLNTVNEQKIHVAQVTTTMDTSYHERSKPYITDTSFDQSHSAHLECHNDNELYDDESYNQTSWSQTQSLTPRIHSAISPTPTADSIRGNNLSPKIEQSPSFALSSHQHGSRFQPRPYVPTPSSMVTPNLTPKSSLTPHITPTPSIAHSPYIAPISSSRIGPATSTNHAHLTHQIPIDPTTRVTDRESNPDPAQTSNHSQFSPSQASRNLYVSAPNSPEMRSMNNSSGMGIQFGMGSAMSGSQTPSVSHHKSMTSSHVSQHERLPDQTIPPAFMSHAGGTNKHYTLNNPILSNPSFDAAQLSHNSFNGISSQRGQLSPYRDLSTDDASANIETSSNTNSLQKSTSGININPSYNSFTPVFTPTAHNRSGMSTPTTPNFLQKSTSFTTQPNTGAAPTYMLGQPFRPMGISGSSSNNYTNTANNTNNYRLQPQSTAQPSAIRQLHAHQQAQQARFEAANGGDAETASLNSNASFNDFENALSSSDHNRASHGFIPLGNGSHSRQNIYTTNPSYHNTSTNLNEFVRDGYSFDTTLSNTTNLNPSFTPRLGGSMSNSNLGMNIPGPRMTNTRANSGVILDADSDDNDDDDGRQTLPRAGSIITNTLMNASAAVSAANRTPRGQYLDNIADNSRTPNRSGSQRP